MIFGIGTDIAKVSRFERWVRQGIVGRFFSPCEILEFPPEEIERRMGRLCEHYAARFAAKEALSKALGTGFTGLRLSDFGIRNDARGKPEFVFGKDTESLIGERIGGEFRVHVSLSHEKEFAVAFAVIEKISHSELVSESAVARQDAETSSA